MGGPYLLALVYLTWGYVHYNPGTAFSLSPDLYRRWAFPAFRYSDIIWLYLRDDLASRPRPYIDYPLEYPPLTGLASWLLGFAPDLPTYFTLTYLVLATAILATIWALTKLPGANPWYFAAAPAIAFYTGHQWDPLAIGITALSLVAVTRERYRLGALGLAAGISLKLFPLAFLAALCVEHIGQRRWRWCFDIAVIATAASLAFNLPAALANRDNWLFFFRWNRDRLADSGIWVLWREAPTETLTTASLLAAAIGATLIVIYALRMGGPILLPLGATSLLWWLLINKTFTTHLMLWVLLALALLRPPLWLWLATVAVDFVGFQFGNFLNLYNVPEYQSAPLIRKAVENIYDPLQLVRSAVLLLCVAWGLRVMWRQRVAGGAWPFRRAGRPMRDESSGWITWLTFPVLNVPRPRAIDRDRLLRSIAVFGSYVAATLAFTWPLARRLGDSTPVGFDPLLQIWLSRWVQHALTTDPRRLYEANIFHPFQHTLAYTDANVPGALLAWPIDLIGRNPILTNNLMILASFVVAATGMYAVVSHLTRHRAISWITGLAYAFLPYRAIHLWHLNWLEGAWLPWLFWVFLRLLDWPTRARGITLGVLTAVLTLTSFYFSVQIGLLLGVVLAVALAARAIDDVRRTAAALAIAGFVAAILIVPLSIPYVAVRNEQGLERTIAETEQYKATVSSYLTLPPWTVPNPLQRLLGVRAGDNIALTTVGQEPHADGH
ncbi:MAG: hypothetical protein IT337_08190, partial [Thermomicrobiales bacterium]|nr:hypothetical protein [Thermomicrobiales bacterium]